MSLHYLFYLDGMAPKPVQEGDRKQIPMRAAGWRSKSTFHESFTSCLVTWCVTYIVASASSEIQVLSLAY